MSQSSTHSSSGIGVVGLLGTAFVVLKLTGYIDWSWWWVTAPFWGGFAIALAIVVVLILVALVVEVKKARRPRTLRPLR